MLRSEWDFKGFVMTDWFAGSNAVSQLSAGNDVLMPGVPDQTKALVAAVSDGTLSREHLDESVERVLNVILQSLAFKGYKYSEQPDLKGNAQITRAAATEGMVLLKNDGHALPLAAASKIALFGDASYDLIAGGTGSGDVNKAHVISLDQGLMGGGFVVDASLKNTYTQYIAEQKLKRPRTPTFMPQTPIPELPVQTDSLQKAVADADVALITLGRNSGEFSDRKVENDFMLSATEQALVKNVSEAFHGQAKKVIVVLNVGGPIEVSSWRQLVDGLLVAWHQARRAATLVAMFSVAVNPSGKLAMTFPVTLMCPPQNFPGKELVGQKSLLDSLCR
jgi:beta-glucosidase